MTPKSGLAIVCALIVIVGVFLFQLFRGPSLRPSDIEVKQQELKVMQEIFERKVLEKKAIQQLESGQDDESHVADYIEFLILDEKDSFAARDFFNTFVLDKARERELHVEWVRARFNFYIHYMKIKSIDQAHSEESAIISYMLEHEQEMDKKVQYSHYYLFSQYRAKLGNGQLQYKYLNKAKDLALALSDYDRAFSAQFAILFLFYERKQYEIMQVKFDELTEIANSSDSPELIEELLKAGRVMETVRQGGKNE